ncbi:Uncharacterized protein APZ42_000872 [Daphnia magna]|uniref:Uncharacterized protein n=1 Tax=Daphnia magna TaxID=35525 RepID=A0A164JBK5_9CRUS|nr:Uncharacterized protein APZ42_000872 [Daphnia magna]
MRPAAECIDLDEKMTTVELAEICMNLLKGSRSWLVRSKRFRRV